MASAKTREYKVRFTSSGVKTLTRETRKAESSVSALSGAFKSVAIAGTALFAGSQIFNQFAQFGRAAIEQQDIFKKLQTSIELTGSSYKLLEGDIKDYFAQLQATTEFGDTDSAKVLTTLTQLTGNYGRAIKALPIALDLASTGLFDVNTAARNVALAMEGNIEMLGRYIPELRAATNAELKNATAAEKAAIAMDVLTEKFGGTAAKNIETTGGALTKLSNTLGDLQETIGEVILPSVTGLNSLTSSLDDLNTVIASVTEGRSGNLGDFLVDLAIGFTGFSGAIQMTTENLHQYAEAIRLSDDVLVSRNGAIQNSNKFIERAAELMRQQKEVVDNTSTSYMHQAEAVGELSIKLGDMSGKISSQIEEVQAANIGYREVVDVYGAIGEAAGRVGGVIESQIFNTLKEGQFRMKDFANAFADMLAQMVAELLARAAIFSLLNLLVPGLGTAATGANSLGAFIFGGSAAPGGGGPAGLPGGGGGGGNITLNINTIDAGGFEDYLRNRGGARAIARTLPELI